MNVRTLTIQSGEKFLSLSDLIILLLKSYPDNKEVLVIVDGLTTLKDKE